MVTDLPRTTPPLIMPSTTRASTATGDVRTQNSSTGVVSARSSAPDAEAAIRRAKEQLESSPRLDATLATALLSVANVCMKGAPAASTQLVVQIAARLTRDATVGFQRATVDLVDARDARELQRLANDLAEAPFGPESDQRQKQLEHVLSGAPEARMEVQELVDAVRHRAAGARERAWAQAGQAPGTIPMDMRVKAMTLTSREIDGATLESSVALAKTALAEGDGAFAYRLAIHLQGLLPSAVDDHRTILSPEEVTAAMEELNEVRIKAAPIEQRQRLAISVASADRDLETAVLDLVMHPAVRHRTDFAPEVESALLGLLDVHVPKLQTRVGALTALLADGPLHTLADADHVEIHSAERLLAWLSGKVGGRSSDLVRIREDLHKALAEASKRQADAFQDLLAGGLSEREILNGVFYAEFVSDCVPIAEAFATQTKIATLEHYGSSGLPLSASMSKAISSWASDSRASPEVVARAHSMKPEN